MIATYVFSHGRDRADAVLAEPDSSHGCTRSYPTDAE
jgi:hypothetical protein